MTYSLDLKGSYTVRYKGSILPFSFTSNTVQIVESTTIEAQQISDIAGYVSPVKTVDGKLVRLGDFQPIYYGVNSYVFPYADTYDYPYQLEIFSREYRQDFSVSVYQVNIAAEQPPLTPEAIAQIVADEIEQALAGFIPLDNYVTKRMGAIARNVNTDITFEACPFENFVLTGLIIDEETRNANIDVDVLFQGDRLNQYRVTANNSYIPEIPMTRDFSLRVRPNNDVQGLSIGIKQIKFSGLF